MEPNASDPDFQTVLLRPGGRSTPCPPRSARSRLIPRISLSLLMLLAAVAAWPADDHPLCRQGFLRIVTPDDLGVTQDQCRAVAKKIMAAWTFDADVMQWADRGATESTLTLRLLGAARMKAEHPGLLGFAHGRDQFVVSTAVLDDPFANGTLAHELGHIQAKRALGELSEKRLVPHYFVEGHGNLLGRLFRDHLGVTRHDYDAGKARQVMKLNPDEARTILTDNSYGAGDTKALDKMEALGIFFVEYLRVRLDGKGVPDALTRMGRVFEAVGRGGSYAQAFQEQYGEAVDRVVDRIVEFFKRTADHPAERWKGTRYEAFA